MLGDSTEILAYADEAGDPPSPLYPAGPELGGEVRRLEDEFDRVLGPEGRLWMYHSMFDQRHLVREYGATGVPTWERRLLPLIWKGATPVIRSALGINDRTAARAQGRVQGVFDGVAERLADGRRFLAGEGFTAADLTFAALSASVLVPEGYGVPLPPPERLPEPMRTRVLEFRDHPAGRFALRIYAEERRPGDGPRSPQERGG